MDVAALPFVYTEELYRMDTKTAVVLTKSWSDLTPEEKEQLIKITDALKKRIHPSLSLEAFQVVVVDRLDLSTWNHRPNRLIYFGEPMKGLANYEVIEAGATRMVLSESLAELIPNTSAKTKLWSALQQLFS